jgi:hypothetical protein
MSLEWSCVGTLGVLSDPEVPQGGSQGLPRLHLLEGLFLTPWDGR